MRGSRSAWRRSPGLLALVGLVVAGLAGGLLAGCAPAAPQDKPGVLAVHLDGSAKTVQVSAAKLDETSVADLRDVTALGASAVGVPVRLRVDGGLPGGGATLTKTYAAPLPADAAATFMWWDDSAGAWEAVPSELSADRRTLTAKVSHFSIWDDFVSGTKQAISAVKDAAKKAGQVVEQVGTTIGGVASRANAVVSKAVQDGADWLFYNVGEVLSTRAEAPSCGARPDWVESATFIEDGQANPLRFCVGGDDSSDAVVKVAANRGYGFPYSLGVEPSAERSSALSLKGAIDAGIDLDRDIADSVAQLTNGGRMVLPGETATFAFSRSDLGAATGDRLFAGSVPGVGSWATSTLAGALAKYGFGLDAGYVGTALKLATCGRDVVDARDAGALAKALISCADTPAGTKALTAALRRTSAGASAGAVAEKLVAKLGLYMLVFSTAFDISAYIADRALPASALDLDVTARANDASQRIPGLPDDLLGRWCSRGSGTEAECLDFAELRSQHPQLYVESSDPSAEAPGATDIALCLETACDMASTVFVRYFPAGAGWSCTEQEVTRRSWPACQPDYSHDHDVSQPRIVHLYNHQQDSVYHDAPPLYRAG